jgi:PTS system nitrogen regulatory IIA component
MMAGMENIMTLEEVAKYLKMKPQTIYLWAQKGQIPAVKLGKEWRFRRDVIDEWLNERFDEKFQPIIRKLDKND